MGLGAAITVLASTTTVLASTGMETHQGVSGSPVSIGQVPVLPSTGTVLAKTEPPPILLSSNCPVRTSTGKYWKILEKVHKSCFSTGPYCSTGQYGPVLMRNECYGSVLASTDQYWAITGTHHTRGGGVQRPCLHLPSTLVSTGQY